MKSMHDLRGEMRASKRRLRRAVRRRGACRWYDEAQAATDEVSGLQREYGRRYDAWLLRDGGPF